MSNIDKLKYDDYSASITREIAKYPKHLGIREVIQNAIEGDGKGNCASQVHVIPVQLEETGNVSKFAVYDNGPGMSPSVLLKATDWSASTKQIGRDKNYGRGEKAATLGYNPFGIYWISCQNGRVNLIKLVKETESDGKEVYGRFNKFGEPCPVNGGTSVIDITDLDMFTNLQKQYPELLSLDKSWTVKIFLGSSAKQNTCKDPYNGTKKNPVSENWAYNELHKRYYYFPQDNAVLDEKNFKSKKSIEILFHPGTFTGSQTKHITMLPFQTWIERFNNTITNTNDLNLAREEIVEDKSNPGIYVQYVFDGDQPNSTGKRMSWNGGWRAISTPETGVVYKGEIFDYRTANRQQHAPFMREFGIGNKSQNFKIVVILGDKFKSVEPDSDRQFIKWIEQPYDGEYQSKIGQVDEAVQIYDFVPSIVNCMPQWFKDKIDETRKIDKSSNEAEKRLQDLLDKLVSRSKKPKTKTPNTGKTKTRTQKPWQGGNHNYPKKRKPAVPGINLSTQGASVKGPKIEYVVDEAEVKQHDIEGRVGTYNVGTNTLYLNTLYLKIQEDVYDLQSEINLHKEPIDVINQIEPVIKKMVIDYYAYKVGSVVAYGLYHKLTDHWTDSEVEGEYQSESSLTAVADTVEDAVYDLKGDANIHLKATQKLATKPVEGYLNPTEEVA